MADRMAFGDTENNLHDFPFGVAMQKRAALNPSIAGMWRYISTRSDRSLPSHRERVDSELPEEAVPRLADPCGVTIHTYTVRVELSSTLRDAHADSI